MTLERTLFFVKDYIEPEMANVILDYRDYLLIKRGARFIKTNRFIFHLSTEQYKEFYQPIRKEFPEIHELMCNDFGESQYPIVGDILEGDFEIDGRGLINTVRYVLGHRIIEQAEPWTIRGKFGRYKQNGKGWRTVAHASTRDQVERDIELFRKWGVIR